MAIIEEDTTLDRDGEDAALHLDQEPVRVLEQHEQDDDETPTVTPVPTVSGVDAEITALLGPTPKDALADAREDAFAKARTLRSEGRDDEADAILLTYVADAFAKREKALDKREELLARRAHKERRARQVKELVAHIDPEADLADAFDGCTNFTDFFTVAVKFAHLDQGPAPKGEVSTGARLFARKTPEQIEAKFLARMNLVHHWEARAWNAAEWFRMVSTTGLSAAREAKSTVEWIPLRRHDRLEAIAEGLADDRVDDCDTEVAT